MNIQGCVYDILMQNYCLTNWPLGGVAMILVYVSNSLYRSVAWTIAVELFLGERHSTSLEISQQWFR